MKFFCRTQDFISVFLGWDVNDHGESNEFSLNGPKLFFIWAKIEAYSVKIKVDITKVKKQFQGQRD